MVSTNVRAHVHIYIPASMQSERYFRFHICSHPQEWIVSILDFPPDTNIKINMKMKMEMERKKGRNR